MHAFVEGVEKGLVIRFNARGKLEQTATKNDQINYAIDEISTPQRRLKRDMAQRMGGL